MKTLNINKKRFGITMIIVSLIMILLGMEFLLHKNIRNAVFVENDMGKLEKQIVLDGDVQYMLPTDWTSNEKTSEKSYILYHNDFEWNKEEIKGYIEVWQNNIALDTFMTNTKNTALRNKAYKNYDSSKIKISSMDAYEVSYMMMSDGEDYESYEYYINGKDYLVKLTFLSPYQKSTDSYHVIFKTLAERIVIKN